MLPFLKTYFQFKLCIYSSLQYIIPKTKQSCKTRMEKQQHITTATLSQSFPLHGSCSESPNLPVESMNASPQTVSSIHKGPPDPFHRQL